MYDFASGLLYIRCGNFVYLQDITLKEAETVALSILKQVMEEKVHYTSLLWFIVL